MRSILMRMDFDGGKWKDQEDIADLVETFIRGDDATEFTNEN